MFSNIVTGDNNKHKTMKGNIGIWMDKRVAKLYEATSEDKGLQIIESKVEEFRPKGGSGGRFKGGPQDVVQDSKYTQREKHQYKDYFKEIVENIRDANSLVIFGPAQTGEKFYKELSQSHPQLAQKVRGVEKADSMTDNQVKSWVRDYFS